MMLGPRKTTPSRPWGHLGHSAAKISTPQKDALHDDDKYLKGLT